MSEPPQSPRPASADLDADVVPSRLVRTEIAARSHPGRAREVNEDSYAVLRMGRFLERSDSNVPEPELPSRTEETGHLMIVADGLGGHAAGQLASRTALVSLVQLVLRSPRWALKLDDPETREAEIEGLLTRARAYFAGAHEAVRERAAGDTRLRDMGTTLTSAYTVGTDVFVIHVGDSRAYVSRMGRLVRITHDHTLAQSYADRGLIGQAEVPGHQLGHVLTRAVGAAGERPESEIHHIDVQDGDRLLLCSDGLTRIVSETEIAGALAAHPGSTEACEALITLALERGAPDNVTVIVAGYRVG